MKREPGCEIAVRVTPKSSQNKMEVQADGMVRVWVNAPPVDGAANDAVRRMVAKTVGVPQSAVDVIKGLQGRDKTLFIRGLKREDVLERISRGRA